MKARWAIALAMLAVAGVADAQYRWRDPNGQVNYGDIPPSDALDLKRVDSRTTVSANDSATALPFELRRASAQHPAVLYVSSGCVPCDGGRAFLKLRGVPFAERTIDSPDDLDELRRVTGIAKVPVLTLGRERLAGFHAADWAAALDAAGYPTESRLPPSYAAEPPQPLVSRASGPANRIGPAVAR
jgi:glutaredoxin